MCHRSEAYFKNAQVGHGQKKKKKKKVGNHWYKWNVKTTCIFDRRDGLSFAVPRDDFRKRRKFLKVKEPKECNGRLSGALSGAEPVYNTVVLGY